MCKLSPLLALVAASSGCVSAITPRTADVAPRGGFVMENSLDLATYSRGEAHTDDGRAHTGNAAFAKPAPAAAVALGVALTQYQIGLRYGVTASCELGAILGGLRVAAEARCALADEDRGAPLSIAAAAAFGYQPFLDRNGPWARVGVDVSRRFRARTPLVDLYASYGPEAYSLLASVAPADDQAIGPAVRMARREARLSAAAGVAWLTRDPLGVPDGGELVVTLVPYAVAWSADPYLLECQSCLDALATDFRADYGIALMLSFHALPEAAFGR